MASSVVVELGAGCGLPGLAAGMYLRTYTHSTVYCYARGLGIKLHVVLLVAAVEPCSSLSSCIVQMRF